jgi:hypothetical protein
MIFRLQKSSEKPKLHPSKTFFCLLEFKKYKATVESAPHPLVFIPGEPNVQPVYEVRHPRRNLL